MPGKTALVLRVIYIERGERDAYVITVHAVPKRRSQL